MNQLLLFCFILLAGISCQKGSSLQSIHTDGLEISMNTACGWCAPGDSMHINKTATSYTYYASSCNRVGSPNIQTTNQNDWKELIAALDITAFNNIDLNACGVCYDGCEEWVTIRQGNNSHTIRYDNINNVVLDPIRPFLKKLRAIKDGF
ncbi:MAG: hypothetical protein ACK5NK_08930 [Niabella sp.]